MIENLRGHVPKPLSPNGTTSFGIRLPKELVQSIDQKRGDKTRSEYIRDQLIKAEK